MNGDMDILKWSFDEFVDYQRHRNRDTGWRSSPDVSNTNLCQYMRFILVWLPLWFAMMALPCILFYQVVFANPGSFFGYGTFIGTTVATMASLAAVATAIVFGAKLIGPSVGNWLDKTVERWEEQRELNAQVTKEPGFFRLCIQWIRETKDRFCSSIELKGER